MEEMMVLLRQLTTKVNVLEKAVTPRGAPVSPDQPLWRSVLRQAIEEGGSLGMQQMYLGEHGGGHMGLGIQTPGGWARAGNLDHEVDRGVPQYQAYRPAPAKLALRVFDGSEVCKGLGAGFEQWALLFIEQVEMAEMAYRYRWTERTKVNKFAEHLRGKAEKYFHQHVQRWWATQPNLWFVMEQMNAAFRVNISNQQAMRMFSARKESSRTWNDHFLYLNALMGATNASPSLVLENVVKYAEPDLKIAMMAKYDPTRPDSLQQASELVAWAQALKDEDTTFKGIGKDTVSAVTTGRKCYKCGNVGHIRRDCPEKERKNNGGDGSKIKWALAVQERGLGTHDWILDSGASRHMVNDKTMLRDVTECHDAEESFQPDGAKLEVTLKGTAVLNAMVDGVQAEITLRNVYYAPKLARNLMSYCSLLKIGCKVADRNGSVAVLKGNPARVVIYADIKSNVLRIAKDPASVIEITSHKWVNCRVCAEGKQTRAQQPTKDTGEHAPVDRVGAVICGDLKGPVTPRDRRGNRYLVNFVDHKSNYCRVFLAKTKDQAAKHFEQFLTWFEKLFGCKVRVLRTDGGAQYNNVDGFCKRSGVARQKSEARNQAANGKAERMHRTVMNIVRCMLFASELPLTFWGDAAEYAVYILNRSPTRANEGRMSPLEMISGRAPSLQEVVVFGSACAVFVDTSKKNLQKRSQRGVVIGKSDETKGYRVYLPESNKVVVTRHVKDIETLNPTGGTEGALVSSAVHVEDARADDKEPASFAAAQRCTESEKWRVAEREEIASLEANNTWKRYKARLVACGNEQVFGIDYLFIFAAVMELPSGKAVLALARIWRVPARHGDVPNAELAALGVEDVSELGLLLGRRLYGLKQAGRLYRKLLHKTLIQIGFRQCLSDSCVYVMADEGGITVVGTYVDDLLVTTTSAPHVDSFFGDMAVLEIKDLGPAYMFLGMRISYDDERGYSVDQEHAITEMLVTLGLENANSIRLPIAAGDPPCDDDGKLLPVKSAPDGKEPTTHAPTVQDWKLAKRIARYLNFVGDVQDRKSVSGVVVQVNGMTIDWECKKQTAVVLSTVEAEFVAASVGGQNVLDLHELFGEIGLPVKLPIEMMIDNQAALKQITSEASSGRAKHVDVKVKFLRDYAERGVVLPTYVGTADMLADLLTKALPGERVLELREKIGLT
ncbi:Mitochondrial Carrier (MC) Family, partial [Phytophthora palmivora]